MRAAVAAGLAVIFLAGCSGAPGGGTVTTTLADQPPRRAIDRHRRRLRHLRRTTPTSTATSSTLWVSSTTRPDPPPRLRREVEVKRGPRTALYTLPADLLFSSGEAVLRPSSGWSWTTWPGHRERFPGRPIIVRGHTDSVGSSRANRELSRRRAEAVAAILLDQGGIGPIEIEASANSLPAETAAGRAQNRRVEILVRTRR